ncbi:hypothetical protein GPALN_011482 [Globodera pallida]|nr:hypothetical protein GPALN_011482 [Globodera pallida]
MKVKYFSSDKFMKKKSERLKDVETVNPSEYRSFCFRGEGCCNLVISAKRRLDGIRIVWRLAKKRNSAIISPKPKCRMINAFLELFISSFLRSSYLIKAGLVKIAVSDLHHLAKIPALPHNMKLEQFSDLLDNNKHPAQSSRFLLPKQQQSHAIANGGCADDDDGAFVCALQMPDATRIPRPIAFVYGPTITLELKPKQGFLQSHPGIDIDYCNNCILQIEKCHNSEFRAMYDFCPLALYSGVRSRMHAALWSLLREPHRNLRLFVDGNVVHEDGSAFVKDELLSELLFPDSCGAANMDTFVSAICCILAGVADEQREKFRLAEGSVLHDLLTAQLMDTVGMVRAYKLYTGLPISVQHELRKKANLLSRPAGHGFLDFLHKDDPRSLISIRLVEELGITDEMVVAVGDAGYIRVAGLDARPLYFAYSVRIVDLDPKSAKNLENSYNRLMKGIRLIHAHPHIRPRCDSNPGARSQDKLIDQQTQRAAADH